MDCPPKKVAVIKSSERDGRCGSGRSWRLVHYKFRQLIFLQHAMDSKSHNDS